MQFRDVEQATMSLSYPFLLLTHSRETALHNYYRNVVYTNNNSCLLYGNINLILNINTL